MEIICLDMEKEVRNVLTILFVIFMVFSTRIELEFRDACFCGRRGQNRTTRRKTSRSRIDLIHKWQSIYNSFVEVQISLPSLDTIQ